MRAFYKLYRAKSPKNLNPKKSIMGRSNQLGSVNLSVRYYYATVGLFGDPRVGIVPELENRYDLKEIAFPSSLPDPPHLVKKRRKLTWDELIWILKRAARLYAASCVRDIGPDLRPHDYKKDELTDEANKGNKTPQEREPSTLEDLAVAARGGMETLRPALQRLYMTRASAYRDALKNFIEGYREGVQLVMEKKEDSKLKMPT